MKINKHLVSVIAILGFVIISNAQVPNYVPSNGLVGWWPFTGNANDVSGNNNNGTVNGATLTSDRFGNVGQAYVFDGTNDNIESMNPLSNLATDFTISCYVSINSWQGGEFVHVGIDQNSNPRDGFGYGYGASQAAFPGQNYLALLSDIAWYQSGYQFSNLSTWYHAIVVRTNNTLDYYVNGTFVGSSIISSIIPPSNSLFFGSGAPLSDNFNGKLDDIGIWNRALTPNEISALYIVCSSSVTTQPINQMVNISNNAQFTTVFSDPLATYQWQTDLGLGFQNLNNVGQYSGATNNTLIIANTTLNNNNQPFRCIISSSSCSDTSDTAVLTVLNNVGIHELGTATKILVKITDLNGKTIPRRKNVVMLFIYEDGTVERVVEME